MIKKPAVFAAGSLSNYLIIKLIFLFIKEEVFLGRIIGPDVFDGLVDLSVVFEFLEVLDNILRSS